jgi:hypothetical protein
MSWDRLNRRRFLKYAGATAAVAGGSAIGLEYLSTRSVSPVKTTPSSVSTTLMPTIENLKWTPTRIQNSKVYDGNISFDVKDLSSSPSEVKLDFAPLFPSQIQEAAIPPEDQRSYALRPAIVSDNKIASFSQDILGLRGGKQYMVIATIKESTGHELVASTDTPYVRQFENAVPSAIAVGVQYGMFFGGPLWTPNNQGWILLNHPLLGEYDSRDPFVITKHLDWLGGHSARFIL